MYTIKHRSFQISTLMAIIAADSGVQVPNIDEIKQLIDIGIVAAQPVPAEGDNIVVARVEKAGITWLDLANQLGEGAEAEMLAQGINTTTYVYPHLTVAPAAQYSETAAPAPAQVEAPTTYAAAPAPSLPADFAPAAPAMQEAAPATAYTAPQLTQEPAAPVFRQEVPAAPALADAVVTRDELANIETGDTVTLRGVDFAISTDVAYAPKPVGFAARKTTAQVPHYPFDTIAKMKIEQPNTQPNFHIAGKKTKDVSNTVRKNGEVWEAKIIEGLPNDQRITFRAQATDANDPAGEGVRVFALWVSEAPARRKTKAKQAAAQ